MGQPWHEVKSNYLNNGGVVFSSNYELYADISNRVMNILMESCPEIDIYSIDEAFLNLKSYEKNIDLVRFAFDCKRRLREWIGIPVSIGIAPTKTLAKLANKMAKDDSRFEGVVILKDENSIKHFLKNINTEKIWGIGKRMEKNLKDIGIDNALELRNFNPRLSGNNFSVVLERTIRELRGQACIGSENMLEPKKQIMVSRSFGRSIRAKRVLSEAISFHAGRAAEKLRFENQKCRTVTAFIRSNPFNEKVRQIYASKFIELVCNEKLIIFKQSYEQIINQLQKLNEHTIIENYNDLISISMQSFTNEYIVKLQNNIKTLQLKINKLTF